MSLVINANTQWWWAYQLSNSEIWVSYPQFENNCILFAPVSLENWANLPTAFSVNWTAVNFMTWVLEAPWCFQIADFAWSIDYLPWWYYIHNFSSIPSSIIRIWTREPIEAWLTIWKTVVFPHLFQRYVSSSTDWLSELTYKVWLLHSDWTISYIANTTVSRNPSRITTTFFPNSADRRQKQYSSYYWFWFWETNEVVRTNWLVSQAWDYIIAEIIVPETHSFSGRLLLWTIVPYWNILKTTNKVFQISVE